MDSGESGQWLSAELLADLDCEDVEALRANLAEGCAAMWGVYLEIAEEWQATDDALLRAVDF